MTKLAMSRAFRQPPDAVERGTEVAYASNRHVTAWDADYSGTEVVGGAWLEHATPGL